MTNPTTYSITAVWARDTTARTQPGGDLYLRPLTRAEMTAPLAWHELQLAVCTRLGELADGTTGYAKTRDHGATWTERTAVRPALAAPPLAQHSGAERGGSRP